MLNSSHIPGISIMWLRHSVLFLRRQIRFTNIVLRIFAFILMGNWLVAVIPTFVWGQCRDTLTSSDEVPGRCSCLWWTHVTSSLHIWQNSSVKPSAFWTVLVWRVSEYELNRKACLLFQFGNGHFMFFWN